VFIFLGAEVPKAAVEIKNFWAVRELASLR
jgi:hypothetical protein